MKTSVNIKMDTELRDEAKALFGRMGLDMTTAVNMFLIAALREKGLPFAVTTVSSCGTEQEFDEHVVEKLRVAEIELQSGHGRSFDDFATELKQRYGL